MGPPPKSIYIRCLYIYAVYHPQLWSPLALASVSRTTDVCMHTVCTCTCACSAYTLVRHTSHRIKRTSDPLEVKRLKRKAEAAPAPIYAGRSFRTNRTAPSRTPTHTKVLKYRGRAAAGSDVEQVYHAAAVVSHRLLRRLALGRRRRELLAQRELVLVQLVWVRVRVGVRVRVRVKVRVRGRGRGIVRVRAVVHAGGHSPA